MGCGISTCEDQPGSPKRRRERERGGCGFRDGMRQDEPGTVRAPARSLSMRVKTRKSEQDRPEENDDLWTWIVIGLIFATVTLALYGPLVWMTIHAA
jgi:hypothetical protein